MANHITWRDVSFSVGDTVRVHQTFEEGDKTRTQIFEGLVIAIRGHIGLKSFVVRRIASNNISVKKITFPQREKEEAKDYRYFPEPDIPPLRLEPSLIEKIKASLPTLPEAIIADLVSRGVKPNDARILSQDKAALGVLAAHPDLDIPKLASLIVNKKIDISQDIKPQFAKLTQAGETDTAKLTPTIDQVIADNPKIVADYQAGKIAVLGFLMGQVMKLSAGEADAKTVSSLLVEKLK